MKITRIKAKLENEAFTREKHHQDYHDVAVRQLESGVARPFF